MKILITGGTGSLGSALAKTFSSLGHKVAILSRDCHKQAHLKKLLPPDTRFVLTDICQYEAVQRACDDQDVVVHCAAIKRIEAGEDQVEEFFRVNIEGTRVVAAAARSTGIEKCLFISSDKAPNSSTLYGATKRIGESVWTSYNSQWANYSVLRYGNVVNSEGSVWHIWKEAVAKGEPIRVRGPEPTRFILVIEEAVDLVQDALNCMDISSGIFVPGNLPAFSLWDLAYQIQPDDNYWKMEPLIYSEKQHEVMLAAEENACSVDDSSNLWVVYRDVMTHMDAADRAQFCSATARRLTGIEVIRKLEQ